MSANPGSLRVYNRANTTLLSNLDRTVSGRVWGPIEASAQDRLNRVGSASVTVPFDHPSASDLVGGNVVRMYQDSVCVYAWTITQVRVVEIDDEPGKVIVASGVGLLGRWSEALVEPWNANEGRPVSLDRIWNWASPELSTTGWSSTVYNQAWAASQWPRLPEAWPKTNSPATEWIWSRTEAAVQPAGISLFRRARTFSSAATVAIFVAANSTFEAWIDGVLLEREPNRQPDRTGYEKTRRYVVAVGTGVHDFAFAVENWGGSISDNPAGLAVSVWTVESDELNTILFTTRAADGDWKTKDYPNPYPGWTAVQILQMCLDEAQARDELLGWTINDNGQTYGEIEEFAVRVGDPLTKVIDALAATYIDVEADPTGRVLRVWPKSVGLGSVTSVDLDPGVNVSFLSRTTSDEITNAVLGVWSEGVRWRTSSASISANGRRTGTLVAGQVGNRRALDQILDAYLDAYAYPFEAVACEVVPTAGAVAGVDFGVGDTVTLDGDTVRCVGLTWRLEADASLQARPEFDTILAVRQQESIRTVERLTEAFDAPATAGIIDRDLLLNTGMVGTDTVTWSWSGPIDDARDPDNPTNPWQPVRLDKSQRIYRFEVEVPAENLAAFTGTTTIVLLKNGSSISTLNLGDTDTYVGTDVSVTQVILPKDLLEVQCTAVGGHIDGSIRVLTADPV